VKKSKGGRVDWTETVRNRYGLCGGWHGSVRRRATSEGVALSIGGLKRYNMSWSRENR
jgi:hypothetical protein